MARNTGVRNLVLVRHGGNNESKRVSGHLDVVDSGLVAGMWHETQSLPGLPIL